MFQRSKRLKPGWSFIGFGMGLCALSLIAIVYFVTMGEQPSSGRAGTLAYLGVPLGIVSVIIGVVKLSRRGERDR